MTIQNKYRIYRKCSLATLAIFLFQLFSPTVAWALTSGPSQPEFSSFEPVATTNMVDVFSGDLTYNLPVLSIPGANGGGYAMSLSYHSGASPEEEASWVGYGWTLNPGAINRNKRGFPDDWNGQRVKYFNKAKPNRTLSLGFGLNPELFSSDDIISVGFDAAIRYNNYRGFGFNAGVGIALGKGVVSLGYNVTDGEGSYSLSVNPANALRFAQKSGKDANKKSANNETKPKADKEAKANKKAGSGALMGLRKSGVGSTNLLGSNYGIFSYANAERATNVISYSGISYNVSVGLTGNPLPIPIGGSVEINGNFSTLTNTSSQTMNTYGYMYSGDTNMTDTAMMDYYTEKNTPYQKNDRFIGIPFGNPDNFSVTGEGIGGGFRLYHKKIGHFRPNYVSNHTQYKQYGVSFDVGADVGNGANKDAGEHYLTTSGWNATNDFAIEGEENEPYFFRFNQDAGGYVEYGSSDAQRAGMSKSGSDGNKSYTPVTSSITKTMNSGERNRRSTYVAYNTNSEITDNVLSASRYYRAYSKEMAKHSLVNRASDDLVGEFAITNEDGQVYTYGLPVYAQNERQVQMGLEDLSGSDLQNMYLAYHEDNINNNTTYVGEQRDSMYATSYLLTSITTPDFIDRTGDGPTEDDFGGYTRFKYKKHYGSEILNESQTAEVWYRWRIPYRGLLYQRNSLSDASDDLGSYTSGEKEIYYLDTIETKTHIAVFKTSDRNDGLGALFYTMASKSKTGKDANLTLQKLDRIELYAKNNGSPQLIKTIHFDYDYSLCPGLPNSSNGGGKLTLKKVWFEYEGIVQTKISPYKFSYQYPSVTYPGKYSGLDMYTGTQLDSADQNPSYSPFNLDPWGNYQSSGASRYTSMQNWVDQSSNNPNSYWDPAAWQLKVIKLPSGGEIHVQYEPDDYTHVQDKRAMAMVSIKTNAGGNKYYIEATDIPIHDAYVFKDQLYKQFITNKERIYFKFLYNLRGDVTPSLTHCNAEYISGYAKVQSVGYDGGGIYITLANSGNHGIPDKVCEDFVRTQRAGMLTSQTHCDPSDGIPSKSVIETVRWFAQWVKPIFKSMDDEKCKYISNSLSYFRVPLVDAKRGGGVRVKRLLMYDEGIESGDAALYGSEYIYKHYDEEVGRMLSSGVATNEPPAIREENALVGFMERYASEPGFLNKVIAGKDKETSEGPLGESLLPGASVGYSKVYIKNIHSGRTNPGFTINEFYTAKDYPFRYELTSMDERTDYKSQPFGVYNNFLNNLWISQGFSFHLYNFHGKPRYTAAYAGDYDNIYDKEKNALISLTEHLYYEPDEEVPVMEHPKRTVYEPLGKEMDLAMESRVVTDHNDDTRMEYDRTTGLAGTPIPFFFEVLSYTVSEMELYTHATSKVTRYPAIEKGVVSYRDGMYRSVEYLAFDKFTGKPLVTKRRDGFDKLNLLASANHKGDYYDYRIPASYVYDEMATKSKNERRLFVSGVTNSVNMYLHDTQRAGAPFSGPVLSLSGSGGNICDFMKNISQGDLVELTDADNNKEVYHLGEFYVDEINLIKTSYGGSYTGISNNDKVDMLVIRSGNSNQLNEVAGEFTTYGNDMTTSSQYSNQLSLRQKVADSLNAYFASSPPVNDQFGLNASKFPSGLSFVNPITSKCDTLDSNFFIRLENDTLKLYNTAYTLGIEIIGSDVDPHPFVDQLNDYFSDYLQYDLTGCIGSGSYWDKNQDSYSGSPDFYALCRNATDMSVLDNRDVYEVTSACSSLTAMQSQQASDLAVNFNYVNDQSKSIDDYFEDVDQGTDYTVTVEDPNDSTNLINKRVLLKHLSTGAMFGISPVWSMYPATNWLTGNNQGDITWLPLKVGSGLDSGIFAYDSLWKFKTLSDSSYIVNDSNYHYGGYRWDDPIDTLLPSSLVSGGFYIAQAGGMFSENNNGYLTWIPTQDIPPGSSQLTEQVIWEIRFFRYKPICQVALDLSGGGDFGIDPSTGQLMYYADAAPCNGVPITCLSFCDDEGAINKANNVVKAQVTTFHDAWTFTESDYEPFTTTSQANDYELGIKGNYRLQANYVYRTNIAGLSAPFTYTDTNKSYNSGTYDMELFHFANVSSNDGTPWLKTTEVKSHSPNGNALEEADILGIYSAAKFGYSKTLPYLVAQNSYTDAAFFESFESDYQSGTYLEDGIPLVSGTSITSSTAHSGARSCSRTASSGTYELYTISDMDDGNFGEDGLLVKVWAKNTDIDTITDFNVSDTANFSLVASRGEWSLYEAYVPNGVGSFNLKIYYKFNSSHTVYIDDVRVQPADAQMTCYVYDVTTHRLITSFDDQHFGLYYQYNVEGKLTRKLKETERGLKTIQETQYHTPKWEDRPY